MFRDVRLRKYLAAFQDVIETVLVCCMPHAPDKLGQYCFSEEVHAMLWAAVLHTFASICSPYRKLMSPTKNIPVRDR